MPYLSDFHFSDSTISIFIDPAFNCKLIDY